MNYVIEFDQITAQNFQVNNFLHSDMVLPDRSGTQRKSNLNAVLKIGERAGSEREGITLGEGGDCGVGFVHFGPYGE